VRGGTAKLLTLFRPATGEVRGKGVTHAPNAVLHPWLQEEVTQIVQALPPLPDVAPEDLPPLPDVAPEDLPPLRRWETWLDMVPEGLPPIRLFLVWDNLAGHKTPALVAWLLTRGIVPLYTPLSGSWLNMAESAQRIIVRRALDGQHPHSSQQVIAWLEATVRGWNRSPTPFTWGGKRHERRVRARTRRLGGSGATLSYAAPIAA
jgi:DDE superfamily endonuclease